MIQSMTGFGSASQENEKIAIQVEIKSLNSKYSDIFCRIPKSFSNREIEIRNHVQKELERGKIEFTLTVVPKDEDAAGSGINRPLVKAYFKDLMETATELNFTANPTDILRMATMMPNSMVNKIASSDETAEEWKLIMEVVQQAINKCKEFRTQEGNNTSNKFLEYIEAIEKGLGSVIEQDVNRIPAVRDKLEKAMAEFVQSENFDKNRFEQELIYYVEKFDISEEKVRLKNHIDYFKKELGQVSNGKKLNFIAQELGREINTIGSKANDAIIQKLVVEMKDELEKIKEQTLNIL